MDCFIQFAVAEMASCQPNRPSLLLPLMQFYGEVTMPGKGHVSPPSQPAAAGYPVTGIFLKERDLPFLTPSFHLAAQAPGAIPWTWGCGASSRMWTECWEESGPRTAMGSPHQPRSAHLGLFTWEQNKLLLLLWVCLLYAANLKLTDTIIFKPIIR